jgi:SAM-dependent methyltransferase
MNSISLSVLISGMILIAVWGLLRFFVTSGQPIVPFRRIIRLIRQVNDGDWRQVLYVIHLKLRRIDVGYVLPEDLGLSSDIVSWHENSGGPNLDRVLKNISINENDSILDIGCGKGGALITLSKYHFQAVDGLDISDKLLSIAKTNFKKLNIGKVKLFHANAVTFTDLDNYTFIYMANPFPASIMKTVISNLDTSIKKHPREITIIYYNPVCHDVIVSESDFRVVMKIHNFGSPFWIYKNIPCPTLPELV